MRLAMFNRLSARDSRQTLLACCAAPAWAAAVTTARPYASGADLHERSEQAFRALADQDVVAAAARHPRIGAPLLGTDAHSVFSRCEQAVAASGSDWRPNLASANVRYEQRFGRTFLIDASDRTVEEILAVLEARLGHSPAQESVIMRAELLAITG